MDINKLTISPEMEAMKNQLIIVLINRLGGDVSIPVSEIDATGQFMLMLAPDHIKREFRFFVEKKQ